MIESMVAAYLACAEWSSHGSMPPSYRDRNTRGRFIRSDKGDRPLDSLPHRGWHKSAIVSARQDIDTFLVKCAAANIDVACYDASRVGHDLWLTRNGHGTGFWDRPEVYDSEHEDYARQLTDISHALGECDPYVGDDMYLHFDGT